MFCLLLKVELIVFSEMSTVDLIAYIDKSGLFKVIKLEVPKEMINITKNDKIVVKKSLTKTNNISKSNKEPSIKIIPGDTNKPEIINDGKEWNIEEIKNQNEKMKRTWKEK